MRVLVRIVLTVPLIIITGMVQNIQAQDSRVQIANLKNSEDTESFNSIREAFKERNPGYDMGYLSGVRRVEVRDYTQIVFVQEIGGITNQDVVAESAITGNPDTAKGSEAIVGDLVYLPRGVMHRGVGGVVTQVITVPGFIPGSEIGVDHHLRAINERLQLEGERKLPYNEEFSSEQVIR